MSVDMYVVRFRQELQELPRFQFRGEYDAPTQSKSAPPGIAGLTASLLAKHIESYKLPDFDYFKQVYCATVQRRPDFARKFSELFVDGEPTPGFLHRLCQWYSSGIAQAYVYTCLVEALEDSAHSGCGMVLHDPRVDWKLKVDALVVCNGVVLGIDCHHVVGLDRSEVVRRREGRERERKRYALRSSHLYNEQLSATQFLDIAVSSDDCEELNGYELYSPRAIDNLLDRIYQTCGVPADRQRHMGDILARPVPRKNC